MNATVQITAAPSAARYGPVNRTIANLACVVGGEAMLRLATLVAAIVIARVGGASIFGIYATALAYVTVAAMIADNGLGITTVRKIGSSPDQLNHIFTQYVISKTILFVPMVAVMAAIGWFAHLSAFEWAIAALITLRTILQGYCQMQVTVLKAIDRMQSIGVIQAAHSLVLLLVLWGCYVAWRNIYLIVAVLVLAQCVELTLEAAWLRHAGIKLVRVKLRDCWRLLHGSTAVGVAVSLSSTVPRLDVILLSLIAGAAVAGVFAAAQTFIIIVYLLGSLLASVLFPEMARLVNTPQEFRRYFRHWSIVCLAVMVPGSLLAIAVGPSLMRTLFGHSFGASGSLLAIMLVAAPLIVLNALNLHRAFALNQVRSYLGVYVGATVAAVLLDVSLGSRFGASGIAIAVVLRECLVLIGFWAVRDAPRPFVPAPDISY